MHMKFNDKLMERMRSVTRSLRGQGPQAATAAIQDALKILSPNAATPQPAPAMRDINPPPASHARQHAAEPEAGPAPAPERAPTNSAMRDAAAVLQDLMPDLMAKLDQRGPGGLHGFKMPSFEMPGGMGGVTSPPPELPGTFDNGSYSNAAGTRSYKLYIPSSYAGQPMPLVVMLHGCTQDPDDFARGTQMNVLAEELHCLVLYPAQSQQANPSRCWNWFTAVDQVRGQGEPSIIAGMTEQVMQQHAVARGQVYVAGLSAGGAMATIMGTLYPELYAAVGVHSGLPFASANDLPSALAAMKGNFKPAQAGGGTLAIIVFHGDRDTTVHPANGDELLKRGAGSGHRAVVEPGRVPDGHAYTRTVHQRADGTPQAEQWMVHGAGHAWSGGSAHGSFTDAKGPDASREMMRFFQTRR
jgi:poly(hydroxyalkanoate) depolymerase family esterase